MLFIDGQKLYVVALCKCSGDSDGDGDEGGGESEMALCTGLLGNDSDGCKTK